MNSTQEGPVPTLRQLTAQDFIDIITLKDEAKWHEFYPDVLDFSEDTHELSSTKNVIVFADVELTENVIIKDDMVIPFIILFMSGNFLSINIEGGTFGGKIALWGGVFVSISISGGLFKEEFLIDNDATFGEFVIDGGTFEKFFRINGGYFEGRFEIYEAKFKQTFVVYNGVFKSYSMIAGGSFEQEFLISGGKFTDNLSIVGGKFEQNLTFRAGFIEKLSFDILASKLNLDILGASGDLFINYVSFTGIVPKEAIFRITNNFYNLTFDNVQNLGTFILNACSYRPKQHIIEEGTPFKATRTKPTTPELRILNSDLGKTTLINCDLSGFDLIFKSSKITDVFVTGTKMPNYIRTKTEDGKQLDFRQEQLGYSQIKKIFEARGDRIEANRYYAKEMEAYQMTLSWHNWRDRGEKFNLLLNKLSTNYGQSWTLGLLTTLVISGLFYWGYCWLLGFRIGSSRALFGKIASYFLEFINPIHKADYIAEQLLSDGAHISGWARTVEGISRIFIAYFVFQLIQAFRKHGKSSG